MPLKPYFKIITVCKVIANKTAVQTSIPLTKIVKLTKYQSLLLGKPQIVSYEGPIDGQVRCVAEGYPTPQIKWYYCDQPHSRYAYCLS